MSEKLHGRITGVRSQLEASVFGQPELLHNTLVCLCAGGHLMIEGVPGLAKTRLALRLAQATSLDFVRIQFTPDMLPSDITGSEVLRVGKDGRLDASASLEFRPGPIFAQLLLADEINRAPAKVQSALLEGMEELQVTVGGKSHPLPQPFMVVATLNPLDHQGTWQLPQAQLDRFLLKTQIDYPDADTELFILKQVRAELRTGVSEGSVQANLTAKDIIQARKAVLEMHCSEAVLSYIVRLATATRNPQAFDKELASWLEVGVSPRASLALERCAQASAWIEGRDFITPDDVQRMLPSVYRHRLQPSLEARTDDISIDSIMERLTSVVPAF